MLCSEVVSVHPEITISFSQVGLAGLFNRTSSWQGQFNFAEIAIEPLDNECNVIRLNVKDELKDILINTNYGPRVISDRNLPILVRHMALHVNVRLLLLCYSKTQLMESVVPSGW